ncbi:MAG: Anguibactin system regulator [Verrucomicrobiae bacterium]|nr:Anguibactin system regulator [Verrucomicrobiae bacterium]
MSVCNDFTQRSTLNATESPAFLHSLFLVRAREHPDDFAVITPHYRLTYGDLHRRALQISQRLQTTDVLPNTLVAVVMNKGWEQIVAVLGVLYAGAAYLPISADLPAERRSHLLRHGEVKAVLTQGMVDRATVWPADVQVIRVDEEGEAATDFPAPRQQPEDLAYVIYTSGSTGMPKGVMIEHRSALNTILDMNRRFGITATDRVLSVSALSFDLSVYDIFGMLAAGGAIVLPAAEDSRDPAHWAELVLKEGVTIWNSAPALMNLYCDHVATQPALAARSLRWVWLSGDWIPLKLPARIRSLSPQTQICSLGGATEASIWSILFPIDSVAPAWKSIPYGRPMENQTVQVLDADLEPAPLLTAGEIYIGGLGVARGYWRDPEKTADRFIRHPKTGARLYRTGDRGRCLPDGNIELLGRVDFQVKIRGFRIELDEIEATLRQHPGLTAAVVTAYGKRLGEQSLAAYVVARDTAPTPGELRRFLLRHLPDYMVPNTFMVLPQLPLTAHGKIDRQALPAPRPPARRDDPTLVAPRSPTEQQVARIWSEVLRVSPVGVHDNFFDFGGTSLLAVQIISRLNEVLAYPLPVRVLFDHPTVASLSAQIVQKRRALNADAVTGDL